ncbi:hypothetical protein B0H67DRAFT_206194 [Lasiosphaeris hirsuta]|uniref:Uncharacterized protein n=1 Tax=Lasiosphaeris hirsuta TaxID=260670 RepID=A0AA40ARY4_9PEZI|nr:hypothetical protein B0H67DRAFT_206194 [Lasiosphaeris hirsuta]
MLRGSNTPKLLKHQISMLLLVVKILNPPNLSSLPIITLIVNIYLVTIIFPTIPLNFIPHTVEPMNAIIIIITTTFTPVLVIIPLVLPFSFLLPTPLLLFIAIAIISVINVLFRIYRSFFRGGKIALCLEAGCGFGLGLNCIVPTLLATIQAVLFS